MRALALVAVLLWSFQSLDDTARLAVQSTRAPAGDRWMQAVSDAGRPVFLLGVLVAVACFAGPSGPAVVREALGTLVLTNGAVEGLKRATFRARPDGEHKRSNAAFPSSHTANAFALAWVFGRRWRRGLPMLLAVAVIVAYSRVYLDRHWLSDVLVGAMLGTAIALGVGAWLDRRRTLPLEIGKG